MDGTGRAQPERLSIGEGCDIGYAEAHGHRIKVEYFDLPVRGLEIPKLDIISHRPYA